MEKSSKFILNNRYSGMDKEIQRSILMFENGCHSPYTRNMYRSKLDQFREHFHIKDFDSLIRMSILEQKEMVEDYVVYRKSQGLVKSTINNDVCAVIADTSGNKLPDGKILDITQDINDYADKYLRKFKVHSIVLNVRMR